MAKKTLEDLFFDTWLERYPELPAPERQARLLQDTEGTKHAFDFSWCFTDYKGESVRLAVEIQGGSWRGGRHNTAKGQYSDYEKHNLASRLGWVVLYFNTIHMQDPESACDFTASVLTKSERV
jgi:hypothetical protein